MAINLQKGQRVSLDGSLQMALVGLGWDVNQFETGGSYDLDASAFLLGANDKLIVDSDFVFYNNLSARNGAVIHKGDNLTGEGEGDDEVIIINFNKIPDEIQKIAICVTIHDPTNRLTFGQVSNAFVRVAKVSSEFDLVGEDQLRFDLGEEFSIETALLVCEIYRYNGAWKFSAVGAGYSGGLQALVDKYQ